jgi:signal transduction histidine kinase
MPGIAQKRFHSTIRGSAAEALDLLAPHSAEILALWKQEAQSLGLDPDHLLEGLSLEFGQLGESLRRTEYPAFRRRLQQFGERLAKEGIRVDSAVGAFNRLFEISLKNLIRNLPEPATPILALVRLHSLVTLVVVSGYTGQWSAQKPTLVEARLAEDEDRRRTTSAYVTRVYERERRRLSQDLHDEIGHDLILIKLYLEMIAMEHSEKRLRDVEPRIAQAIALVSGVINSVRRLVLDLGPAVFEDLSFLPAVKSYVNQFSAHTGIRIMFREGYLPAEIPMSHQVALYRVMQGALSNVLKHAFARTVRVSLTSERGSKIIMIVEDDGVGFDTAAALGRHSFGLTAMQERVEVLGGKFQIQSNPSHETGKGHGTRIEVSLPLPDGEAR